MNDAKIGNEDFPALWVGHQVSLLVYIMSAIANYEDAQDLLQKVAVVAFRKQASFDPECMEFGAWVRAIARFEILRFRRDHVRDRLVFDEETLEHLEAAHDSLGRELDERFAALRSCLQTLKGRARRVIELRYRDGATPTSIAEQLCTSAGAINVALNKARRALRACIERQLRAEIA